MNAMRTARSNSHGPARAWAQGFTLIEVGVVLVIMTLVVTGLLSMFLSQLVNTQVSSTRNREDAIKTALSTFISRNNRLPCPADPLIDMNSNLYGTEVTAAGCLGGGVTATGGVAHGIVPFSTLGLSSEGTADGYNNRLTYAVTVAATTVPANGHVSGMQGNIAIHNATPVSGANQLNGLNPAVAVIVSHGSNGFGAYRAGSPAGTRVPLPTTTDESENTNADAAFVQKDYSEAAANPFDDIVMWITPADLLTPLQRDGSMQSARAVTMERLRAVQAQMDAQISSAAPGNIPSALPAPGPNVPTQFDAWGRAFSYVPNAVAPVCSNPSAPAIAYQLVSTGLDGVLGGAPNDDIFVESVTGALKSRIVSNGMSCP